jgi:hypothetical protein
MSTSISGTAYTPYASGTTITSGGAGKTTGGGRGNPICIFTSAFAGIGARITNVKRIDHKSNFFILLLLERPDIPNCFSILQEALPESALLSLFARISDFS